MVLVIFNDDVNSFEHVIETLKNVCNFDQKKAEELTTAIDRHGSCSIMKGEEDILRPYCDQLCNNGLDAKIVFAS